MLLGFNHNIMYRGEIFHVQTEDSGVENPNIVTLLYKGGVILCSIKTSYADILRMDNLEQVVEELMKEQHKQMMRRLKSGEFDERIAPAEKPPEAGDPETGGIFSDDMDAAAGRLSASSGPEESATQPELSVEPGASEAVTDAEETPVRTESLDEAILAFFGVKGP